MFRKESFNGFNYFSHIFRNNIQINWSKLVDIYHIISYVMVTDMGKAAEVKLAFEKSIFLDRGKNEFIKEFLKLDILCQKLIDIESSTRNKNKNQNIKSINTIREYLKLANLTLYKLN